MNGMGWIVLWLAAIVLGVLALMAPLAAGVAVTIVVAWVLMVVGVLHAAAGLHAHRAKSRLAHFALGFLYVVTGIYLAFAPAAALLGLTVVLAVVFVTAGLLRLIAWRRHRGERGDGWLLFDGGVSIVLGLMIGAGWPASAAWAPGTLLGVILVINGISGLMFTLALRHSARVRL